MSFDRHDAVRVVLLGASNLARSFPLVAHSLPMGLKRPIRMFAALGHGRSYGTRSRVFGRVLPGIVECGLWRALEEGGAPREPLFAALVDVGTDLVYGASVEQISRWIATCMERLGEQRAEIVLMLPPMASIEGLSNWRFELLRRVFFPAHPAALPALRMDIRVLEGRMRELARQYRVRLLEQRPEWYGFDPIHYRRRQRLDAWHRVFSAWSSWDPRAKLAGAPWRRRLRLRALRPAQRWWFGYRQVTAQPVFEADRISISLY